MQRGFAHTWCDENQMTHQNDDRSKTSHAVDERQSARHSDTGARHNCPHSIILPDHTSPGRRSLRPVHACRPRVVGEAAALDAASRSLIGWSLHEGLGFRHTPAISRRASCRLRAAGRSAWTSEVEAAPMLSVSRTIG